MGDEANCKDSSGMVKEVGFLGLTEQQHLLSIGSQDPCVPLLTWIIKVCVSELSPLTRDLLILHNCSFLPMFLSGYVCLAITCLPGHYLLAIPPWLCPASLLRL